MTSRHSSSSNGRPATSGSSSAVSSSAQKKESSEPTIVNSLYVRVKFNNNLPDLPFDPKFLINPLDINRFVDYQTTTLEQNAKHELITPADLGVDIDLILPERYAVPSIPEHDPDDEKLLNEDDTGGDRTKKSPRDKTHSQLHNKVVPWLKKTEYISTEYNRYGSSNEKAETKVGYNVRKNLKEEEVYLDKESQIKAINATFEAARKPIRQHPTKPGVTAVRTLPVLPDFEFWNFEYVHVKFDSDPATDEEKMKNAIMKGAVDDETHESMVKYFLPTEITLNDKILDQAHGMQFTEGKEYEYKSVRDYGWSFKPIQEDYFFSIRDDAVYYNRLALEVALKKKRSKSSMVTTLLVKHRDWDQDELAKQADKSNELDKPTPAENSREDMDLTAQALEQSYEEMAQEGAKPTTAIATVASPEGDNDNDDDGASSSSSSSLSSASSSSSSSSSSPDSSSAASSSGEDSDDNKDKAGNNDEDDDSD